MIIFLLDNIFAFLIKLKSSKAFVDIISLSIPIFKRLLTSFMVLIPPPYSSLISMFFFISAAVFMFTGFPYLAPSRSIKCIHLAPISFHLLATNNGESE